MSKISIIIPVYNMEKTLHRVLDSIACQTYPHYEVIMIDDGSTDSSSCICDEYASNYDKFRVIHKQNGGVSSARNVGIAESRSPWITFCDADDYVYPEWLANFHLEESDGYDLLTQGMRADKPFFGIKELHEEGGFNLSGNPLEFLNLAYTHSIVGYAFIKAFRRSIVNDYGIKFDQRLWLREDDVFLFEYLAHCKNVRSYKEIGYFYFSPDWARKYQTLPDDRLILEESVFNALKKIQPSVYNTQLSINNRNAINRELTEAFFETKRLKYVRKLRDYFRMYPDFATLLGLTRKLIQMDSTCLISGRFLYMHMLARRILNMGGAKDRIFG